MAASTPAENVSLEMDTLEEIHVSATNSQEKSITSRRKRVMEWMNSESRYPVLVEVFQATKTVESFHLAEENKQEFPHDDGVKVAQEMANKLLNTEKFDPKKRKDYLKSILFCVHPESLTPLAVLMYQEFPVNLSMLFQSEDEKKVKQLCICLFVRGLLSDKAMQNFKAIEEVQATVEEMIKKDVEGSPEQLLTACRTTEETERSFYSAYRGWREIPQTDAEHITEAMMKHWTGTDEERKAFLASMYFSLNYHTLLPLVIVMFQKYREICPDKLELPKDQHNKEWNFLGRVLLRKNLLTKEEYSKNFSEQISEELDDKQKQTSEEENDKQKRRKEFEEHGLCEFFDKVWDELPYASDVLSYDRVQLPYDDAIVIAKLMLPFLNGDKYIYRKTMSKLSYRRKFWKLSDDKVAELTKENFSPCQESIVGEYNNVAVIMCQQYMDWFPDYNSDLVTIISPQYTYPFFVKCLWQWNVLSEVAVSLYLKSYLHEPKDDLTISHGLLPLLFLLTAKVYEPVFVSSEASDFSKSTWIQSSHDFNQSSFMKILVTAAIEREEKTHPKNKALYQVLVKAIGNHKSSGMKVELILDELLPQVQPQDGDVWDSRKDSDPLYILAARRGPQFINVAFKLLELIVEKKFHKESMSSRVMQLIQDEATDYTVASIIDKVIDSKVVAFSDREKVELVKCCAGKDSRSLTAKILWKCSSHLLKFLDLLSAAESEDVPFAILEEFNIYLYPDQSKTEKHTNSLHVAADKGYTSVVELALERGFTKLLTYTNEKDQYPVQVALEQEHYDTAAVMLRAMNDYELCLTKSSHHDPKPRVNFRELLMLMKNRHAEDQQKELQECILAILDSTVDRDIGVAHHEVLEVDCQGYTPDDSKKYTCPGTHSIEMIMRDEERFEETIAHKSFQSLVKLKWKLYGQKIFFFDFAVYLSFVVYLTTAFALGASKAGSPSKYNQPLDGLRLFCEIMVLWLTIGDIIFEIIQFVRSVRYSSWRVYVFDWTNWFDDLAILMTLLVIPFRIASLDVQWVFVALAYILHCLRIFKFAAIKSSFAVYVQTLFLVIKRDMLQFMTVFLVVAIAFGGGLYFSLRADTCRLANEGQFNFTPVTNTSLCLHPDETSEIYLSWLTGLRLLVEGSVIDPYIFGDRGFWWFSVIIYMVFLFLVAVIMLNLLIAQFNKSYEEISKKARNLVTPDRAKILIEQQSSWWKRIFGLPRLNLMLKKGEQKGLKFLIKSKQYYSCTRLKKDDDEAANDSEEIYRQLLSSTSTNQKQFKEIHAQLIEVKADIAKSTKEQVTTDYLREEMNKQATQIECVQSSQSEVVKELQREVRSLATAFREQTELVMEQQRQMKESLKSLGEVRDILQQVLQK